MRTSGIAHEVVTNDDGEIELWTLAADHDRARSELDAYDGEDAPPPPKPEVPRWGGSSSGFVAAWLLVASFGVTSGSPNLALRGSAKAERILAGEWWRAATALTLHADLPHVLGNAAAAGVLMSAAAWRLGPGMSAAITLATGVAGNLLTAWIYSRRHDSVGASTAVFGTLGLITAIALFDAWRFQARRRAPWVLVGASIALLGFMGTSERADVIAHAAGWLCGIVFGLAALAIRPAPVSRAAQAGLLAVAFAVISGAWIWARNAP